MFEKVKQIAELLKVFKGLKFDMGQGPIMAMITALIQMAMQDPAKAIEFVKMLIALFSGKQADSVDIFSPVVTFQTVSPDEVRKTFGKVQDEYRYDQVGSVSDGLAFLMSNFDQVKEQINGIVNIVRFWKSFADEVVK